MPKTPAFLFLLVAISCGTTSPRRARADASEPAPRRAAPPAVRHWGEIRAVLRDGRTEPRVELADVVTADTVAVGALEGLAAEVTVLDGVAHLAEVEGTSPEGLRTRIAAGGERATLLVAADVREWSEQVLEDVPDLAALEERIATIAAGRGLAPGPFPFRVEGTARRVALHVLDHSCPIAHPDGPAPWRFSAERIPVRLVGFHAEGAGGVLTHHGQATHTHVLLPDSGISGHLDEVSFASGARLFLPARSGP